MTVTVTLWPPEHSIQTSELPHAILKMLELSEYEMACTFVMWRFFTCHARKSLDVECGALGNQRGMSTQACSMKEKYASLRPWTPPSPPPPPAHVNGSAHVAAPHALSIQPSISLYQQLVKPYQRPYTSL